MGGRAFRGDARYRSVEAGEGIHVLYREIGAQGNPRPVVDDTPEGIEPFDTLRTLGKGSLAG